MNLLQKTTATLSLLGTLFSGLVLADNPVVIMETNLGTVEIELNADLAPASVENFMDYAGKGFYDGTIFHRVIPGFMAQGGGFTPDMNRKNTSAPITNESDNGLKNKRGTIAMARTNDPNSATSQFFINLTDNNFLDGRQGQAGYAVFGEVVNGMEVVEKMAQIPTGRKGMYDDVPREDIVIKSVVVKPETKAKPASGSSSSTNTKAA